MNVTIKEDIKFAIKAFLFIELTTVFLWLAISVITGWFNIDKLIIVLFIVTIAQIIAVPFIMIAEMIF